jgi:ribonuclease P protein subunit POP4
MNPIAPRNLLRHELIGLEVRVVESTQPSHIGIEGRIINETRNTLTISHRGRDKIIAKETATFNFRLPNGSIVEIEGKNLIKRPEDRVKIRLKKLW